MLFCLSAPLAERIPCNDIHLQIQPALLAPVCRSYKKYCRAKSNDERKPAGHRNNYPLGTECNSIMHLLLSNEGSGSLLLSIRGSQIDED